MKLLSFVADGVVRLGALRADDAILDLSAVSRPDPAFASMLALIEAGPPALDRARELLARSVGGIDPLSVCWLAPLPLPPQIRDFLAFEEHMRMAGFQAARVRAKFMGGPPPPSAPLGVPPVWYKQPVYYKANRFAVAGPDTTVRWPAYSTLIDYECEIACVIGKRGVDIAVETALDHIFGYTIFNDLTARDAQFRETAAPLGPAKGKDFDGANVFGPVVVTADAIDIGNVAMCVRVNGELRSEGNSATMHWSFAQMITHVSQSETLFPGEILGSGTVGGGCGLELGRFLKHGDRVRLEVDHIGAVETTIDAPHVLHEVTL